MKKFNFKNSTGSFFLFFIFLGCMQFACKKDSTSSAETGTMQMHLTDAAGNYDAVYIDIQAVEVTGAGGVKNIVLKRPGIYNILNFRNGLDTLLGDVVLPVGTVSQIRLILGANNSVVVDGVSHPLSTPSAQQSGLKLNLHSDIVANTVYDVWVDFDAQSSIVSNGNGDYSLKPVIKAYTKTSTGAVKGVVKPYGSCSTVLIIHNTDTISGNVSGTDGRFFVGGLNSGVYLVVFKANPGYADKAIVNISVSANATYDMGTINL